MAQLAKLAGLSPRWVIMLLPRLEERDLIRTEGGRGAAKWIWLLPLGVPRLGKPSSTELTQKEKSPEPSPGTAKAPHSAAQPKRRFTYVGKGAQKEDRDLLKLQIARAAGHRARLQMTAELFRQVEITQDRMRGISAEVEECAALLATFSRGWKAAQPEITLTIDDSQKG
jgi:hypothetical protein